MKELWEAFKEELMELEFSDESCGQYDEGDIWRLVKKYDAKMMEAAKNGGKEKTV